MIVAPLLAFLGRFLGRILTTAFGWATIMLFGRVPRSKQLLLSLVSLGAVAWVVALAGILLPDAGTYLLAAVPRPGWVRDEWMRLVMLGASIALPLLVGLGGLFLLDPADRPQSIRGRAVQVLRGYPYSAVLALTLAVLILVAPTRKVRSIARGWEDSHVPMLVHPGRYEEVVADLEGALQRARLEVSRRRAPLLLELPAKLLAVVGGQGVRDLVPDRLLMLTRRGLEVTIHPTDVSLTGEKQQVARARAAIASQLPFTRAYLTVAQEAQRLEDRLRTIANGEEAAREGLAEVDRALAAIVVPEEEWEVLYRTRLQVERDILRRERHRLVDGQGQGLLARLARLVTG